MSQPLIPRPSSGETETTSPQASQKPGKTSTACGACKQRKTKCSGSTPCNGCTTRGSTCVYDVTSDQRRKIAKQRKLQDLSNAKINLERHQRLLGGIIATIRAGSNETIQDLIAIIRSGVDLLQLAAHARNARRANPAIEDAFSSIVFVIDRPEELPSPTQLLTNMPSQADSPMQTNTGARGATDKSLEESLRKARKQRYRTGRIEDLVNPPTTVPAKPWTTVTDDNDFVSHLISLWFTWAHPWWHWVDEELFLEAMRTGDVNSPLCTPYLVNMILADSCLLDVLGAGEAEPNVELRDQFYAEAVRGLEGLEGPAPLATIQAMGVQWTYLDTNGQDKIGHRVLHEQLTKAKDLDRWRAQLEQDDLIPSAVLEKVDRCLDRLAWTLYTLSALSLMSFKQVEPPSIPSRSKPVHDYRVAGAHANTVGAPWISYPEQKKATSSFHPDCHLSSFLSLAETACKDEALFLQQYTKGGPSGVNQFYEAFDALRNWSIRLPECMQLTEQATPHVLALHAIHNWTMIILSKEAAAAEAGRLDRPVIMKTPQSSNQGTWRSISISSALAISNLMGSQCRNWGIDHFPVIVMQPMSLALFTLLEGLESHDNRSAFTSLCFAMHAASRRFRVGKGILHLVQTMERERSIQLPSEVEQLFAEKYTDQRSAQHAGDAAGIDLDYLLGKWNDFNLIGEEDT